MKNAVILVILSATLLTQRSYADDCASLAGARVGCQCGVRIVSWRVVGMPGQVIWYNGERHAIPPSGLVEFVSTRWSDILEVAAEDKILLRLTLQRDVHSLAKCDEFASCLIALPVPVWLPERSR